MQPETRYAPSKDGYVAYQIVGHGPLDLVFIPGWANNVEVMWEEPTLSSYLRRLATFSRLLCFDKRGTGVSDPVPLAALPTLEEWMDDVRAVMDAAGSKRAALLGSNEGGPMATWTSWRPASLTTSGSGACSRATIDWPMAPGPLPPCSP